MSNLSTLIKLQKTKVDDQRQLLARLQDRLEEIENEIAELQERQEKEQRTVHDNPDMGMTYGDFVRWAIDKSKGLEKLRLTAEKAVDIARDKLAELYEEQKRYELAEAARLEQERREELKRETNEMDEIGSISFVRKNKE